jgi:anti-sigma factor ChrR (cupin superfamily)
VQQAAEGLNERRNKGVRELRWPGYSRPSTEVKNQGYWRRKTPMADAASLSAIASRFIETDSIPWIETSPGSKMKVIYHDPATDMLTILSKLEPGAGIPPHVHEDLEQTFVLEGSLVDQEGECTAGNFVIRAKGSRHSPTAPNGCTMVVFFMKPTAGLKKALLARA